MAHPDLLLAGQAAEQRIAGLIELEHRETVLAALVLAHLPAEEVRHELLAVADAEHRLAVAENVRIDRGTARVEHAARSAGDHDALGESEVGCGSVGRPDLGIDAQLADLTGFEMAILSAGVEDDDLRCGIQIVYSPPAKQGEGRT